MCGEVALRIGELAELAGVTTRTIRHYHRIGLVPEPQRAGNGYRCYRMLLADEQVSREMLRAGAPFEQLVGLAPEDAAVAALAAEVEDLGAPVRPTTTGARHWSPGTGTASRRWPRWDCASPSQPSGARSPTLTAGNAL